MDPNNQQQHDRGSNHRANAALHPNAQSQSRVASQIPGSAVGLPAQRHANPSAMRHFPGQQAPMLALNQQQSRPPGFMPQQQAQQQWKVPNPLGLSPFPASRQQQSQQQFKLQQLQQQQSQLQQQQLKLRQQQQQQQQQRQIQANQFAQPAVPRLPIQQQQQQGGSQKKKVTLTQESKQALARAIYSSIKHPEGKIDPQLMAAAERTGLPRHAIIHAAQVTRQREAQKKANNQQRRPAPQVASPSRPAPAPVAAVPQRPPAPAPSSTDPKVIERANWKRTQQGIFMHQKSRWQALPFSVGAMIRTTQMTPVVTATPRRTEVHKQAAILQRRLLLRQQSAARPMATALANPDAYKRMRLEPKKYSKSLDRVARKARQIVAESFAKQAKDFHKALSSHYSDFVKFHKGRRADLAKVAKAIRDSRDKQARQQEKDVLAAEKARLEALKANDMTAYSKLLEDTKNDRLRYLLDQTEEHFAHITTLLQQREGGTSNADVSSSSYYASAHQHAEQVRQPTILVGGDLKEYQLTGLQWMVSLYNNKLNGILADEMGLGKTIQAISLLAYLMEFKQNLGPYLVIVPLSTLSNWENEFAKWCPAARTVAYKGNPSQRRSIYKDQVQAGHFNVLLTTYEYIIKDKKMLRKISWQYAIVDEGHRMKNANSKFAVTLSTMYETKYRILLTGTPLMNDLSELWALLNFLLPSVFNSVETFDQWFSRPFAQFSGSNEDQGDDSLLSNEERVLIIHRLHELLRPFMLRRVKSEVLDQLPEKVEKVLRCDLSSWQKMLYKQISQKAFQDGSISSNSRGLNNIVMQLRKVCNHPYLFSPEGYHISETLIRSSGKFALLDQMLPKLKAAGHRVLMFTQMTAVMTILEDYFAFRGYPSLRLDGSTPADEREKRMYKFNSPDSPYFIFLLSTRAGGLGLNLTSADTVIIFDSDWNPMMDLQAQDRAHRIGQRSDVSVFRLITYSPVEEKILSRATEKLNVSELVVESGKFNKDSVESDNSLERKKMMEVLLTDFETAQPTKPSTAERGSDDEDEDDGSEGSDKEDMNELLSNNEHDYRLYAQMDKDLADAGKKYVELHTSDDNIPEWIRNPNTGKPTTNSNVFAAPMEASRKRKNVAYDDGLTEKQFLRLMEKQATVEEEQAKKKQRVTKNPSVVDEMMEEPLDEAGEIGDGSVLTDWTFRKLISCSKSVVALKDPTTKRRLSEIFLEKPDPATFPDYYEIIEKPIAINDILRKCRGKMYTNVSEFREDWILMFANALRFNGEGSWVVEDATALEKELERVLKKNGFTDDQKPPTCKKKKKLRIKLSLKG